jgi:hypothetical protein
MRVECNARWGQRPVLLSQRPVREPRAPVPRPREPGAKGPCSATDAEVEAGAKGPCAAAAEQKPMAKGTETGRRGARKRRPGSGKCPSEKCRTRTSPSRTAIGVPATHNPATSGVEDTRSGASISPPVDAMTARRRLAQVQGGKPQRKWHEVNRSCLTSLKGMHDDRVTRHLLSAS